MEDVVVYERHPVTGVYGTWIEGEFVVPLCGGCGGGSGGGGSGSTTNTTVVNVPGKTEEEKELDAINLEIAKQQKDQLFMSRVYEDPETSLAALDDPTKEASLGLQGLSKFDTPTLRAQLARKKESDVLSRDYESMVTRQLKARMSGEAFLTPQEQAALDKMYDTATTRGNEELTRYAQEVAGQRGMRVSDSPIGNEIVREKGRLTQGLEAAKASSSLDLVQGQKTFEESIRQFQAGLAQQAFQNRLSLASAAPLSFNLAGALAQQRFAGISQTSSGSSNQKQSLGLGEALSGTGGLLTGFGIARGGFGRG